MIHTRLDADAVLHLKLQRPAKRNALSLDMSRLLLAACKTAVADDAVRALLLSGDGSSFCAGKDRDEPASPEFAAVLQELAGVLLASAKPVVACVHGWVIGAGLELMLNADIVVAERSARFVLPEVRLGLFGTGAITALLPAAVGLPRAKALMMLGSEFGASDAERWGLVATLVDEGQGLGAAQAIASTLAGSDSAMLGFTKTLLHEASLDNIAQVLSRESAAHRRLQRR